MAGREEELGAPGIRRVDFLALAPAPSPTSHFLHASVALPQSYLVRLTSHLALLLGLAAGVSHKGPLWEKDP